MPVKRGEMYRRTGQNMLCGVETGDVVIVVEVTEKRVSFLILRRGVVKFLSALAVPHLWERVEEEPNPCQ